MGDSSSLSPALTGLSLGIALASTPGPVQAILFVEALRGALWLLASGLVGQG